MLETLTARAVCALAIAGPCLAQALPVLPDGFEAVRLPGAYGIPVGMTFAPDGSFFVVEKRGAVRFHDGEALQDAPVIDLADEVNLNGDRGMLGITLHPGFVPDGGATSWMYLLYTVSPVPGEDWDWNEDDRFSFGRLTRYRVTTVDGTVLALENTRRVLLGHPDIYGVVPDGVASIHLSHSTGTLLFGADGTLLVSNGDGSHFDFIDTGGFDPTAFSDWVHPTTGLHGPVPKEQDSGAFRALDLRSLAGKVLRLDPATGNGLPSNPFWNGDPTSNASRVWARGLRNPFRMALVPGTGYSDPSAGKPGHLLIGDVGGIDFEEVDLCQGGENFGWPCFEGPEPHPTFQAYDAPPSPYAYPDCASNIAGGARPPLVAWRRIDPAETYPPGLAHFDVEGAPGPGITGSCAIGGAVYRGTHGDGGYPSEYEGRFFFGDYGQNWIKTLATDGNGNPVALHDFGADFPGPVDLEAHPLTGEIHVVLLEVAPPGHVYRIRYDGNHTPVAVATADPTIGDAPLLVQFDGSRSFDVDEEPLDYEWDFGDGSPVSVLVSPTHEYTANGTYEAVLTVTDPRDRSSSASVTIVVGNTPPLVEILSPLQGQLFEEHETLVLSGAATDLQDEPQDLTYRWSVDLYHNTHVHPTVFEEVFTSPDPMTTFEVSGHGDDGDIYYYRVELGVTDTEGLAASAHVFVLPHDGIEDVTGTALPIARVQELTPPVPIGQGNPDIEVMRDAHYPVLDAEDPLLQFDTFHSGQQEDDDWIGFELAEPPVSALRFVSLLFQEGLHYSVGGWFLDLDVEVRDGGNWHPVEGLTITPDYPFDEGDTPYSDGEPFETYELRFDPTRGDAIRLRGTPGGTFGFVSVAELRVRTVSLETDPGPYTDVTAEGSVIAKLFSLDPPVPNGRGNPDPETMRNGTWPPVGSESFHAQFDTFHDGDQAGEDWIGYAFTVPRRFSRVVFQEGRHAEQGGRFTDLAVQVHATPGGAWSDVTGLVSTPPYPGTDESYETFVLDFDPVVGQGIRLFGGLEGTVGFVSAGELRVYTRGYAACPPTTSEPAIACGGDGEYLGQTTTLTPLGCTSVPYGDFSVRLDHGTPLAAGALVYGTGTIDLAADGGGPCLDGDTGVVGTFRTDGSGSAKVSILPVASDLPFVAGTTWHFQALLRSPGGGIVASDAMTVTFEP